MLALGITICDSGGCRNPGVWGVGIDLPSELTSRAAVALFCRVMFWRFLMAFEQWFGCDLSWEL